MNKLTKLFAMVAMATMLCAMPAYAAEPHTGNHGTESSASVSDDSTAYGRDTATNQDSSMGTNFYIYLPPDPSQNTSTDVPKMGDTGINQGYLLLATVAFGGLFLGSNAVANHCERERKILA